MGVFMNYHFFYITCYHGSARVFKGRQRKSLEINKRLGNLTPAVSKTPEPIVTTFGVGDDVGDPYLCKILLRSDKGFLLPDPHRFRARRREQSDSASFFGSSDSLQPRALHRFSPSIRQMTSFRARKCILGVPKTKFYISTPFSPKNANFWHIFDGT